MSNIHTMTDHVQLKESFTLAITAATVNGTTVDCQGYERALAIFNSAPSGGGTTSDCKVQEDDQSSGATAVDVTGATFTQVTTAGGKKVAGMNINLSKRKRYLRLVHTGAGGAAAGQAVGLILLFNARNNPPAQDVVPKTV
jgi:hypothetical protein